MFSNWPDIVEAAGDIDGVLEVLPLLRRRHTDRPAVTSWLCCWIAFTTSSGVRPQDCSRFGFDPDPHRILARAEDRDVADARQAGQFVLQVDDAVIGEERLSKRLSGEVRVRNMRTAVDCFCVVTPWTCTAWRQLRQRARHPVLDQHLRHVRIGADFEGDDQRIGAVACARRLHVDHAGHAVDLLLDGQRDRVHDDLGAGARIARRHRDRWRHDVRVLRDRQPGEANRADEHSHKRNDVGQDRTLDKIA